MTSKKVVIGGGVGPAVLKAQLDQSSIQVRNEAVAFTTTMLFVLAATASSTHLMLFTPDSKLALPLVQVHVSLIGFNIIAPFIFFVFHVNFLFNLEEHASKFLSWRNRAIHTKANIFRKFTEEPEEEEHLPSNVELLKPALFQFMFNYSLGYSLFRFRFSLTRMIVMFMTWFVAFAGPLIVLLFVQLRFIPYHDPFITGVHKILVVADGLFITLLWLQIRRPDWSWKEFFSEIWIDNWPPSPGRTIHGAVNLFTRRQSHGLPPFSPIVYTFLITITFTLGVSAFSVFEATIPQSKEAGYKNTSNLISAPFSYFLNEEYTPQPWLNNWFPRNLDLESYIRAGKLNLGKGADFSGRDLRFANLRGIKANGIVFSGANLYGADLRSAELVEADFQKANLIDTELKYAKLNGANMEKSLLKSASLSFASLEGANLSGARAEGALFLMAHMEGIILTEAHLEGAFFGFSHLEGADMSKAHLEVADLSKAYLKGANLHGARLDGANLTHAHLAGVVLNQASIIGAKINKNIWVASAKQLVTTLPEDWPMTMDWNTEKEGIQNWNRHMDEISEGMPEYKRVQVLDKLMTLEDSLSSKEWKPPSISEEYSSRLRELQNILCYNKYVAAGIFRSSVRDFRFEVSDYAALNCPEVAKDVGRLSIADKDATTDWIALEVESAFRRVERKNQ